jgi:hypothetical protein
MFEEEHLSSVNKVSLLRFPAVLLWLHWTKKTASLTELPGRTVQN